MKNKIIKISLVLLLAVTILPQQSCKKDFVSPNAAPDDKAISTPLGLTGIAVGLQRVYTLGRGSSLYNLITINGLTTNELIVVNTGNTAEVQLASGGNAVDGNHAMLTTFWSTLNKVIYDADIVIENAKKLGDKNYASGLIAYSSIFKALSIGDLSQFWEKIPAATGVNVTFIDRIDGYKKAIKVIDDALAAIAANSMSTTFLAHIPAGIDIINTLHALKARYSLFAGLYAQALAEANLVDLSKKSTFNFDALSLNPLYEVATSTNNVVQPRDSTLGLPPAFAPDLNDKRVAFYTSINPTISPRFRINGFGAAATTPIPVYLIGEIMLIKAEAHARLGDQASAATQWNIVKLKQPGSDPNGVGAGLTPTFGAYTQSQNLDSIYKHRSIELYMSGLKLEDMRRFNRPTAERRRNLMPYPLRERDNNPNTPPDPPF